MKVTHNSNDLLAAKVDTTQADPLDVLIQQVAHEANDIWACDIADKLRAALGDRHACLWLMRWSAYTNEEICARLGCKASLYYELRKQVDDWLKANKRLLR